MIYAVGIGPGDPDMLPHKTVLLLKDNEVNFLLTIVPRLSRVNPSITVRIRNDRLSFVLSWTKS